MIYPHNRNFYLQKRLIHITWKFPCLTKISPPAAEISVKLGNIFSYERIFLTEWDIFFPTKHVQKVLTLLFYIITMIQ